MKNRILILCMFSSTILFSQTANVPLDYRGYEFVDRLETRGVVTDVRNGTLPFSRARMAELLISIEDYEKNHPGALSSVEMAQLERMKGDFVQELKSSGVSVLASEKEPHIYSYIKGSDHAYFDFLMGGDLTLRSDDAIPSEKKIIAPYYGAILRGSLKGIGFFSDNRILSEWGSRKYSQSYQSSDGYPIGTEKDSSRATWDQSESYVTATLRGIRFQYGRDRVKLGPSQTGLMLSGLAPAMDLIKISTHLGRSSFMWLHGELRSDYSHKWISCHRWEFSPKHGIDIGIHESVIYGKRGVELAYLNPLMPYLVAEHTLGDRDNVALGFDVDVNRIRNLNLYTEWFIDDLFAPWDLFKDYYGNKYAFNLGGHWVNPFGLKDTGMIFEYTHIEPFVYTHEDTVNIFEHYNFGLGHSAQPNSEKLTAGIYHRFSLALGVRLDCHVMRHGEGERRQPHLAAMGESKQFLSGVLEKEEALMLHINWEPIRDIRTSVIVGRIHQDNVDFVKNQNRCFWEGGLSLSANW